MRVTLQYFGRLMDQTNVKEERIEIASGTTLQSVVAELYGRYEGMGKEEFQIAVNNHIVTQEYAVREGDIIALLPPFAGG